MLLLIFFAISVFIFLVYWKFIRPQKALYDTFCEQGVSCEPFKPLIGQLLDIHHAFDNDTIVDYRNQLIEKHGYVYTIGFGPSTTLVIMDADMLADVFGRTHSQDYRKPVGMDKYFKPLIGIHNLLVSEGEEHTRARQMLNPAFHYVHLQSMIDLMIDQTKKTIDELFLLSNTNQFVDLDTQMNNITLAIIASSAFGKDFQSTSNSKQILRQSINELLRVLEYRAMRMIDDIPLIGRLPFWGKKIINKCSMDISNFVDEIISDRRHEKSTSLSSNEDLLDLLLSAVDDQGKPFDNQEIKDQALTFVLAGHETTGSLLTWTMYVLMTNEKVFEACREEVDRILPNGAEITRENLNQLVVCEAILQETLRLYPPASFLSRECIREHYIGKEGQRQIRIPVGAKVMVSVQVLHQREEYWSQPTEFDYTRWMRDPITGLKPKLSHPFCYLPFGAGPRNCIGQNFALLESKIILAMLIQRCNFEIEPGQKIVPVVRIAMKSKYGLRAKITQRSFN
ncbi:unnamed protein product [Adineta ricciae]|uniref:Cytochrome P450 n=1 Tax=Adineta ricciae TaxID=249248 RepID=A0A814NCL0_ADIRI|nr:unnamed protein product [Adineta ricciae]CAF1493459.1 unnamed protein product [Adineta ricciae]